MIEKDTLPVDMWRKSLFKSNVIPHVKRFSICTTLSCALFIAPVLFANEGFERWKQRIPGHPVFGVNYAPTVDLHRHCPDFVGPLEERGVRGGFTPECEARLDEQFFDEVPPLMPFNAQDYRITWRYVFERPINKRWLVRNALSKPECLAVPDDATTLGLTEHCRVDAIVDYAVLKYKCASGYYRLRGRIDEGVVLPWYYVYPLERFFDNESYWQKRHGIENGYFRYAWVVAKCAGLRDDALASLGVFENTMDFGGIPATGEENWWWAEQGFEAFQLMGIADRLFDNFKRTEYGYETDTLSTWQRVQPVMAELLQIKQLGTLGDSPDVKAALLKHFIAAQTWIKKRREDVNEDWLLTQVGEFSDEELTRASEEATAMMREQGVGTNWN